MTSHVRIFERTSTSVPQQINIDATTGVASYAGGLKGMPIGLPVGRRREYKSS